MRPHADGVSLFSYLGFHLFIGTRLGLALATPACRLIVAMKCEIC